MNYENTELTIPELLSRSFQEIKKRFVSFFLLVVIGPAVGWLINGLLVGFNPINLATAQQQNLLYILISSLLSAFIGLWILASFILYVCKRSNTVSHVLVLGLRRFPRLLLGSLFVGVILLVFFTVLAIGPTIVLLTGQEPGIMYIFALLVAIMAGFVGLVILVVYLSMWFFRLTLTNEPFFTCLRNAMAMVKGRFWKTLGFIVILGLINSAISVVFGLIMIIVSLFLGLISPSLLWLISLFYVPLTAVTVIITQVPLIALYLDRLSLEQRTSLKTDITVVQELNN